MALQLGALRHAMLEAGATSAAADRAAEEVGGYDNRLAGVETKLAGLTWMAGANIALTLLIIASVQALWAKLGEISGQLAQMARVAH